ncbi:fasciclin-like arabinogalactan protein 19 [Salvia miltiorrhiza]|uniref:fasciclin-like arabinogalactan protein 19 n=1 Tax=Salvia miltiorrhiza TaxID=226208 RepID=UPI0025AB73FA|nr:fasciclin-like arabinogalactan protein 19 [Salvia miltiorrhiza]
MAFPSPPPPYSSAFLFLLLLAAAAADSTTQTQEFEDMLQSLRNYGYSLFTNGIATSDLKYELLAAAAPNFTLFAPRDELLYALDMATDAAIYVSTLRYHVIPNRHTFADLKNLSAPFLDTLLPDYAVLIGKVREVDESTDRASIGLIVDGVRIVYPDLFLGSRIAVHGIDGILLTGLNMSRDHDDASPLGSPAPAPFHPPTPAPALDRNLPAAPPPNDAPTSSFVGNIPADWTQTPESSFSGNIPASEIDRNDVRFDWVGTPRISQDQIEKMKRLGMKLPGKGLQKGRRRYPRRIALGDL